MKNKTSFFFLLCGFMMILSHGVMAACSSPSGSASQTRYASNKMYYCNNTVWVEMGGGGGGGTSSCSSQTVNFPWINHVYYCGNHVNTRGETSNIACSGPHKSICTGSNTGNAQAKCIDGTYVISRVGQRNTGDTSGGSRSCSSCFAAGSTVLMADGMHKAIEDIKVGELLMGSDGKPTRVAEYDRPIMEHRDGDPQRLISINDKGYLMTNNHPVLTTDGWKALWVGGAESEAYDLLKKG